MPDMPATRWNCNKRDKTPVRIDLRLKVQKLLNQKFESRDASIDKSGATSCAIPKYRVRKTYPPKLISTPENPSFDSNYPTLACVDSAVII